MGHRHDVKSVESGALLRAFRRVLDARFDISEDLAVAIAALRVKPCEDTTYVMIAAHQPSLGQTPGAIAAALREGHVEHVKHRL